MSTSKASKAATFGTTVAYALKKIIAAERRLIDRAGDKKHLVKLGLIAGKLAIVVGLAFIAVRMLLWIVPLFIVIWVLSQDGSAASQDDSEGLYYRAWYETGSKDDAGYR